LAYIVVNSRLEASLALFTPSNRILASRPVSTRAPSPNQLPGFRTAKLPMGSVAKYSASRKHSTVVSSPGQNPPYAALSKTKGRYVIYGIRVGGSRGNRAICAAAARKSAAA
jgi:hypothetical protein